MSANSAKDSANGTATPPYSIPLATHQILHAALLQNPLIAPSLPKEIHRCAAPISFTGTPRPSIPIPWRFAESISALKGLEAATLNVLLLRKYGLEPQRAVIDTDHAQLFLMSALLPTLDPAGRNLTFASMLTPAGRAAWEQYFPDTDLHGAQASLYRGAATNIYGTADGKYFHVHGSMDPGPTLEYLGLPRDMAVATDEESWAPFVEKVGRLEAEELQRLAAEVARQAGTICYSADEYRASEHGKANAGVGLYEIRRVANESQKPCWWPEIRETGPQRPLAGLKVPDLTRIIAAPAVTRGLAEMGASVLRITARHVTDMSGLHCDMNWGKWNAWLDFRDEGDREKLRELVREADVVVQGYRPGVLDKYGFGVEGLLELTKDRERGLVVARENCYGWHGPWAGRSGWQQISDANTGVSLEFGRAMGNDEPVTPVFPNSDFCTGVAGVVAILNALLRRAEEGGSYEVDIALNYYNQWLVNSVGTYPPEVWEEVWSRNGRQVFRHYHHMPYTLPRYLKMLKENSGAAIFKPQFFETRHTGALDVDIVCPKPIITFPDGAVQLKFNVGTRGNGVDQPRWPEDLMTEVIA